MVECRIGETRLGLGDEENIILQRSSNNFLNCDSAFERQWPKKMNGDMAQTKGHLQTGLPTE